MIYKWIRWQSLFTENLVPLPLSTHKQEVMTISLDKQISWLLSLQHLE